MQPPADNASPRRAWQTWLHILFLIRPAPPSRVPLLVWVPLAALSMGAAGALALLRPGSLADLWLVREWLHFWTAGGDPFTRYLGQIDYPPTAFIVLWPLTLPSDATARWLFVPWAILMIAVAGLVLLRWFSERTDVKLAWDEQVGLVAMFLSTGSARSGIWTGQTAALAVLLGALSLYWCARRPVAAAVALALCGFKPHVAIGFALAILLTGRWVVVCGATAIAIGMWGAFAATVEQSPAAVLSLYTQSLLTLYDGPDRVRGLLSIRFVIEDLLQHYERATIVYTALALSTLALLMLEARRRQRASDRAIIAAACLVWPLLFLPNQLYHGVLAAPAIWLLMWPEVRPVRRMGVRMAAIIGLIVFSVLDVPRIIRLATDPNGIVWGASYYLSPLWLVLVFGLTLKALYLPTAPKVRQPAA
jgi:hypothetical protein